VKDQLQVLHGQTGTAAAIRIFTAEGKMLLERRIGANTQQTLVNVASLPAGNYILRFVNGEEQIVTRFTKQ